MNAADRLRAMIAREPSSVSVTFGAHSTPGLLDFDGEAWGPEGQAQVGVETISLTYCFPDLPGLAPDGALTVDGRAYVVARGPRRKGDGVEAVVILENA